MVSTLYKHSQLTNGCRSGPDYSGPGRNDQKKCAGTVAIPAHTLQAHYFKFCIYKLLF